MANESNLWYRNVWRVRFIGALTLSWIVILALLGYTLFVRFPSLSGMGDANLAPAIGIQSANVAYWLLGLWFAVCYVWVTIQGTHFDRQGSWQIGVGIGLLDGLLWFAFAMISNIVQLPGLGVFGIGLGLLMMIGVGITRTMRTGHVQAGLSAGAWCGQVLGICFALNVLILDNLFTGILIQNGAQDPTCKMFQGMAVAACEFGDDLGTVATFLILFPLLGAGLGCLGALIGRGADAADKVIQSPAPQGIRPLTVFLLLMIGTLVVGLAGHVW